MATVEFLAFPGYVRKVLRKDEADEDPAVSGEGLRCRLWSKNPPSKAEWHKAQTYILDLAAHPGANPNFAAGGAGKFQCEAPGLTKVGKGADAGPNGPFDLADDYTNRVYLATTFWNTIDAQAQPAFPPVNKISIPERKLDKGPQDYEFKIFTYSNDDATQKRRNHRYVGRYAEVVSPVNGNVWNVAVFKYGSGAKTTIQLDFDDLALYGGETAIAPVAGSHGALYLDFASFPALLDLPKLPASEAFGSKFGEPAPTVDQISKLINRRGGS